MSDSLFTPITMKGVTFKNRIVMAPMCMYASYNEDGMVTPWHVTHYESRAAGQAGLICIEATSVTENGTISPQDLGIYDDGHVDGLKTLTDGIHRHGAKAAIQLAHAGRKAVYDGTIKAPSAIPFDDNARTPDELTTDEIKDLIRRFQQAAIRANQAGFDVIELHGAHGYLINQFLSPLSNKRTDQYGGTLENRFRLLKEITEAVQDVWDGPLFVRLSLNEYHPEGNQDNDFDFLATELKRLGVDLIDCSSGGVVRTPIDVYPGYQIPLAERLKAATGIRTGAVGLITTAETADEIIRNDRADLVFLGRELLRNPYWPLFAAETLKAEIEPPKPYRAGWL
ncbi:NADPH dehydrogenase NamA [Salisediminibacterium selenitireducens]|uniref:NADH:flavin oxidoreductase/NADH oxidase n=1 Tax=Bacillus selenitireducens (strain ATCC 700615 / DSM 15326 / MLS10) TaxID=439292 RepID=D6XVJ6_BACIE|nr:NADPH dehydrogenase NamA [Salisediminibacterium selenitireducens]ADH99734.1 NADH:flavin oxidoreductase/NADH oxidase [[Bacillus] selenitireducens MLS10]